MKLVEILARDFNEWPAKVGAFAQDENSKVAGFIHGDLVYSGGSSGWHGRIDGYNSYIRESRFECELADDHATAIVTRAQWQEAREALSKPADTPAWNGEGHPPLGTICEFTRSESPFAKCEVVFSSPWVTVVRGKGFDDDAVDIAVDHNDRHARFRPIRTPEQIAAEERDNAIQEMSGIARKVTGFGINIADMAALYDAGYRKVKDGNQEA